MLGILKDQIDNIEMGCSSRNYRRSRLLALSPQSFLLGSFCRIMTFGDQGNDFFAFRMNERPPEALEGNRRSCRLSWFSLGKTQRTGSPTKNSPFHTRT